MQAKPKLKKNHNIMTLLGIIGVLAEKTSHTQKNALHIAVQLPKEGTQVLLNAV